MELCPLKISELIQKRWTFYFAFVYKFLDTFSGTSFRRTAALWMRR